jgi:hypothetical protein
LPFLPLVARRAGERLQLVEARVGAGHLGAEQVTTFQKTKFSQRQYCSKCGGHLTVNHPTIGLVDVFAATIPTLPFTPAVHINYSETVLRCGTACPS